MLKKIFFSLFVIGVVLFSGIYTLAGWVSGYYRSNGTYVNSYYRTTSDGYLYNNKSYQQYPSRNRNSPSYGYKNGWYVGRGSSRYK